MQPKAQSPAASHVHKVARCRAYDTPSRYFITAGYLYIATCNIKSGHFGAKDKVNSRGMLAAQPARLVLRVDDQIGNKGSVFALRTTTSQPSQATPPADCYSRQCMQDNACRTMHACNAG